MATVGQIEIDANLSGAPSGTRTIHTVQLITAGVDATNLVTLVNGTVTVTVPAGSTACILFPPNATYPKPNPTFAGVITLRGVAGDTGVAISNTAATYLAWDTAPASFVLNSTAAGTLEAWFS